MESNSFKVGNLTVHIDRDEYPESPREWENLGTVVCWHRNYTLGDKHKFSSNEDFEEWLDEQGQHNVPLVIPLYLYDHSGITMSTGPFSCPWDSGQVGWIYITRDKILSEFPIDNGSPCLSEKGITYKRPPIKRKRITKSLLARVRKCLEGEIETYDQFLTGDVYAYRIEDEDGETVDSCGGMYGHDYTVKEATIQAQYTLKYREED